MFINKNKKLQMSRLAIACGGLMYLSFNQVFASTPDSDMSLYLELTVNGVPTHHSAFVEYKKPYYYISGLDLEDTPLDKKYFKDENEAGEIILNENSDVKVSYNAPHQMLDITVPPNWLPLQVLGEGIKPVDAKSSFGAIFNYDIYAHRPKGGGSSIVTWNELRIFTEDKGSFTSSGTYNAYFGSMANQNSDYYRRYDTYWEYSNDEKLYTARVGDLYTRPLSWTSSARLGGAQISHNFSLRPDLITYPLPEFNGQVGVPSTVDLLVNGNKAYSSQINPGPYDISDTSHINGAGNATIVTTDALGRTVSVDVPFYVTSQLLKKGLIDYTVSTGSLRKGYGQKNFSYTQYAVDASVRYGLTNEWTIEGHTEFATSLQVLGLGFVTNVGRIGVVNASFMGTRYKDNNGHQFYVGYEYSSSAINFSASYRKRSEHYRDIGSMDVSNDHGYGYGYQYTTPRYNTDFYTETIQTTASKSFKDFGSISLGYYSTKYRKDGERDSTISAGWTHNIKKYGTLSAYINRNSDKDNRWAASIQWTISLDNQNSISASMAQSDNDDKKDRNYSLSYDRSMPSEGGFGWRMNYNHYNNDRDNYYNGAVSWRNNNIKAEAGTFGSSGNMSYWGDLTGSLIYMDGQVMMANEVTDSFVLVSASGVPDVPVQYENNIIGKTNSKGYVFVPDVTSYYDAKYAIEGEALPLNVVAKEVEKRVAVRSNSGYKLEFAIDKINPTILTLVDKKGVPIEIGSHVVSDSGEDSYVGWDGEVYFEHLKETNRLNVKKVDGKNCDIAVNLSSVQIESQDEVKKLGEYQCL